MVKCIDCGFLCVTGTSAYYPVSVPGHPGPSAPVFVEATRGARRDIGLRQRKPLVCFAEEPAYAQETSGADSSVDSTISKERCCNAYEQYVLGHSPKEHVEMRLLERQKKREDKRDSRQQLHQWGQLVVMLATVAAILVAAWVRPAPKVEIPPIEITLYEPVASDSEAE